MNVKSKIDIRESYAINGHADKVHNLLPTAIDCFTLYELYVFLWLPLAADCLGGAETL